MLSAHQIYQDSKENSSILISNTRKLSSVDKPKNVGLKISTNINQGIKKSSSDIDDIKKQFSAPVKKSTGKEIKSSKKELNSPEVEEEWPEIENMFIYEEPEDDYEDILPRSERFTQKEIDCLFSTCYIGRQVELTCEDLPYLTYEKIDLTKNFFLGEDSPSIEEEILYDDTPLEYIPGLSFDDF